MRPATQPAKRRPTIAASTWGRRAPHPPQEQTPHAVLPAAAWRMLTLGCSQQHTLARRAGGMGASVVARGRY